MISSRVSARPRRARAVVAGRLRQVDTHGQDVALVRFRAQNPRRMGMTFALNSVLSDALSRSEAKYTPEERTSWETTTRSRAVDDERAAGRHEREVAHEDVLLP